MRSASAGPAIHLPIFDAGALRAQLKGRYAESDFTVAVYNQTLITALTEVAIQRSSDAQLVDAQAAQQTAQSADELAITRYEAALTNQPTVLNADVTALNADQAAANLQMNRRDQQIALGGCYFDTSADATHCAYAATQSKPVVAAR
jgi:outer membrane protein TolC